MGFFSSLKSGIASVWSSVGGAAAKSGIPGVSTAGEIVGGIGDNYLAGVRQDEQNNFNAQQAQLNRDFQRSERLATQEWNLEMWNRNNEYNSPAEQLKRAQAAGINPNLLFGNGNSGPTSSPVTSQPMSGSMAQNGSSLPSDTINRSAELASMYSAMDNLQSQTSLNLQEYAWNSATWEDRRKGISNSIKLQDAELRKIIADINLTKEQTTALFTQTYWLEQRSMAEIQSMNMQMRKLGAEMREIDAKIKNLQKQGELIDAQVVTENELRDARKTLLESQAYAASTQGDVNYENANLIDSNADIAYYESEIKRLEYEFTMATGIPSGTPEFEANMALLLQGKYEQFWTRVNSRAASDIWDVVTLGGLVKGAGKALKNLFSKSSYKNPSVKESSVGYPMN